MVEIRLAPNKDSIPRFRAKFNNPLLKAAVAVHVNDYQ